MAILKKKGKKKPELTGKLGPTVLYPLNGKTVGRSIGKSNKLYSQAKLTAMQAMAVASEFLNPILDFINVGFSYVAKKEGKNAHNMAVSQLLNEATQGQYPDVCLDYSKLLVSKGRVLKPTNPEVTLTAAGLEFKWEDDLELPGAHAGDQVMLMAYYPNLNYAVFELCAGKRNGQAAILILPKLKNADRIETYIAFSSANQKRVSDSVYTGSIKI